MFPASPKGAAAFGMKKAPQGWAGLQVRNLFGVAAPWILLRHHAQAYDAGHDEGQADKALNACALTEKEDADKDSAHCTYACPDRVGSAKGEFAHGKGKQRKACHHEHYGRDRRPQAAKSVGKFHGASPGCFQKAGDHKIDPVHTDILSWSCEVVPVCF